MKKAKVFIFLSVITFLLVITNSIIYSQIKTEEFVFEHNGIKLNGFIDYPDTNKAFTLIIIIPGSGPTDFAHSPGFDVIRSSFVKLGITVCLWDKQGCGKSQGVYNDNQTMQSSAQEAIVAINKLQELNVPGSNRIGLLSGSRGGWIAPIIIEQIPSIAFWISISGPDDKDNSIYKLSTNLRVMGKTESEIQLLMNKKKESNRIFWRGGTFKEYQEITKNLDKDSAMIALEGEPGTEEHYLQLQKEWLNKGYTFDYESGMIVMVSNFKEILKKIQCPVLAIFGEKDTQLDWKSTMNLYKETMGNRENKILTIKTFPNCNHSIMKCRTGGMNENLEPFGWQACDGFFETMNVWLKEQGFGK
jgi:pimeloyl-ACP methyl ester carboxylesterase